MYLQKHILVMIVYSITIGDLLLLPIVLVWRFSLKCHVEELGKQTMEPMSEKTNPSWKTILHQENTVMHTGLLVTKYPLTKLNCE